MADDTGQRDPEIGPGVKKNGKDGELTGVGDGTDIREEYAHPMFVGGSAGPMNGVKKVKRMEEEREEQGGKRTKRNPKSYRGANPVETIVGKEPQKEPKNVTKPVDTSLKTGKKTAKRSRSMADGDDGIGKVPHTDAKEAAQVPSTSKVPTAAAARKNVWTSGERMSEKVNPFEHVRDVVRGATNFDLSDMSWQKDMMEHKEGEKISFNFTTERIGKYQDLMKLKQLKVEEAKEYGAILLPMPAGPIQKRFTVLYPAKVQLSAAELIKHWEMNGVKREARKPVLKGQLGYMVEITPLAVVHKAMGMSKKVSMQRTGQMVKEAMEKEGMSVLQYGFVSTKDDTRHFVRGTIKRSNSAMLSQHLVLILAEEDRAVSVDLILTEEHKPAFAVVQSDVMMDSGTISEKMGVMVEVISVVQVEGKYMATVVQVEPVQQVMNESGIDWRAINTVAGGERKVTTLVTPRGKSIYKMTAFQLGNRYRDVVKKAVTEKRIENQKLWKERLMKAKKEFLRDRKDHKEREAMYIARRYRLCYRCGEAGHMARSCTQATEKEMKEEEEPIMEETVEVEEDDVPLHDDPEELLKQAIDHRKQMSQEFRMELNGLEQARVSHCKTMINYHDTHADKDSYEEAIWMQFEEGLGKLEKKQKDATEAWMHKIEDQRQRELAFQKLVQEGKQQADTQGSPGSKE